MREIKFRGKTIDGDKWIHGALLMSDDEAYITEERAGLDFDDIDFGYIFEKVHQETVGQFTGLHGMNGKEIYEGDILQNEAGGHAPVVYRCGGFFVELVDCEEFVTMYVPLNEAILFAELIGNIHENSELLND